ncbi:amidohydrolase family protein [Nesterenkonia haasae]|uniref:amidohydrolase family protein n=1 Tax=Nesterenkonia haasae TaxID=2587813 RepID=UPI001390F54A|nr:amidohydrolase family protein [Nesterenkonia haasae]NDK32552.1 amidohydrolase family protein [Nesterenkonia haasae]
MGTAAEHPVVVNSRQGAPVLFSNGTVLTMDAERSVLEGADVLVVGDTIERIGVALEPPEGTQVIDASGGIIVPGFIDTHRHMWQTAMRGYGADWTLTQYFVWNYLEHGKKFRPQDIYAGNLLSAVEAIDAGVTTSVDWSHGLSTVEHADAAVDALQEVDGRFIFAYGNIHGGPWEWTTTPEFRDFVERRIPRSGGQLGDEMLGFQLAFDVTGDPEFPEKTAFEVARELDVAVTTHAGVWGATNDDGIRLMHEHGFMNEKNVYVHAATLSADSYQRIAATGGSASVSSESESSCGQGYPSSWALRKHGVPVSLSVDTSVWWSADAFASMRATLSADRAREHFEHHAAGDTCTNLGLRTDEVVEWATRGGAKALGLEDTLGSLEAGKKADVVLIKNDESPAMFPILNPHGHVVFQAHRGDVHTVLVGGKIVKHQHKLVDVDLAKVRRAVEETVDYIRAELGQQEWEAGMYPEVPETKILDNPYTYTEYRTDTTHTAQGGGRPE